MPRQPLEASAAFCVDNAVHQFVGVIEADSILPVLDFESSGYESLGSHSSAAEVFMANTADPPQPAAEEAERERQHEALLHTLITGDSPAERALEAQRQALLGECARLAGSSELGGIQCRMTLSPAGVIIGLLCQLGGGGTAFPTPSRLRTRHLHFSAR